MRKEAGEVEEVENKTRVVEGLIKEEEKVVIKTIMTFTKVTPTLNVSQLLKMVTKISLMSKRSPGRMLSEIKIDSLE